MSKKTLSLRFGGKSVAGIKEVNQDAFAAHLPENSELEFKGGAAVIADGVSSCPDSHIASQTSVTSFMQDYFSTPQSWSVRNSVSRVLTALNSWLHKENTQSSRENDSMLCTFTALVVKSNTLHLFHVGDSRVYLYQDGELEQLTVDHVRKSGGQNYLARALGGDRHLEVDYSTRALKEGDCLLMTTDGVHEFIPHKLLKEILSESFGDPEPDLSLAPQLEQGNVVILRSFGKFYGLAGVRLGFALTQGALADRLADMVGPWPVSGPAIDIACQALADTNWQEQTIDWLTAGSGRLDAMAQKAGWELVGGTPLFRTYATPDATAAQNALAAHHVWSRIFPYSNSWIRLGLPREDRWSQLEAAMEAATCR